MDFDALLPFWIIGAPLLLAIIDWMRMPKASDPGPHTHMTGAHAHASQAMR